MASTKIHFYLSKVDKTNSPSENNRMIYDKLSYVNIYNLCICDNLDEISISAITGLVLDFVELKLL